MKTLLLLRHAKSDWSDPWQEDVDRPLAPRGRDAAPRMAGYMKEKGLVPDLVFCSAARRARETWDLVGQALGAQPTVRVRKSLYAASPNALIQAIRKAPRDCARLLVIGHNPEIEDVAHHLAGSGKQKAIARLAQKFPTAALAELRFAADDWAEIADGSGELHRFVRPRDLT